MKKIIKTPEQSRRAKIRASIEYYQNQINVCDHKIKVFEHYENHNEVKHHRQLLVYSRKRLKNLRSLIEKMDGGKENDNNKGRSTGI